MSDLSTSLPIVRDRALRRVADLHDDYFNTAAPWQEHLVRQRYGGPASKVINVKTGLGTATEADWRDRARTARLRSAIRTFKDVSAQFELYLHDLLRVWLTAHPRLVEQRGVTIATLFASPDLAVVRTTALSEMIDGAVLDHLKRSPSHWFAWLTQTFGVPFNSADRFAFVERKAARDVLEHHDGRVDQSYVEKVGPAAPYRVGDHIDPDDAAIDELYDLTVRLIIAVSAAAEHKHRNP